MLQFSLIHIGFLTLDLPLLVLSTPSKIFAEGCKGPLYKKKKKNCSTAKPIKVGKNIQENNWIL